MGGLLNSVSACTRVYVYVCACLQVARKCTLQRVQLPQGTFPPHLVMTLKPFLIYNVRWIRRGIPATSQKNVLVSVLLPPSVAALV